MAASALLASAPTERSLPSLGVESNRRRFRELAGGPVGVTAAEWAGSVGAACAVDWTLSKHDTQTQTDLKVDLT